MITLNREVFVATLPDVTGGAVLAVIVARMGSEQPLHPARNVTISVRPKDQVDMIWHQADCEQRYLEAALRLARLSTW